ncbi:hypothetical protein GN958_ATG18094 [Phytophthora infestans]|uniref:Uncharacterized protein n=1 Tax=Phytophthora infestans TaxID=4787 RepID=A0A8S9TVA7_PHYIN|nr:hypothetical protein GN958_ATG18094 [Phytophthora infestans]
MPLCVDGHLDVVSEFCSKAALDQLAQQHHKRLEHLYYYKLHHPQAVVEFYRARLVLVQALLPSTWRCF